MSQYITSISFEIYQLISNFTFHVNRSKYKKCCTLVYFISDFKSVVIPLCSLQTATQGDGAFFQASLGLKDRAERIDCDIKE